MAHVKVLIGEHDPVFDAELMRRTYLQRYAHASVEVIRNAGHYPMNETPLALVAAIESFLRDEHGSTEQLRDVSRAASAGTSTRCAAGC